MPTTKPTTFRPTKMADLPPNYVAHAGQTVEVVKELGSSERVGPMFLIRAADGWEGVAYPQEITQC